MSQFQFKQDATECGIPAFNMCIISLHVYHLKDNHLRML